MTDALYQVLPPLSVAERAALKASIAESGILVPVEIDEDGNTLDGHHRLELRQELIDEGVPVPDYPRLIRSGLSDVEKRTRARGLNCQRRTLTQEQRRALIADQIRDCPDWNNLQIAYALGVSQNTVDAVRADDVFKLKTSSEWTYETARQAGRIAARFGDRSPNLDFVHYLEVASLTDDEAQQWLVLAEEHGWSRRDLRRRIKRGLPEPVNGAQVRRLTTSGLLPYLEGEPSARRVALGEHGPGQAVVYAADWSSLLTGLPDESVDLLVTDPPYMTDVADIAAFAEAWAPLAVRKVRASGRAFVCIGAYPDEIAAYIGALRGQSHLTLGQILVWTYRNTLGPAPTHAFKQNWQAAEAVRVRGCQLDPWTGDRGPPGARAI